jgi:carboxymethylenebutenolidase
MHMKDLVLDGDSLVGASSFEEGVDRRVFLKAAVGGGFAAATLPVVAQTLVKTDTTGLSAGKVANIADLMKDIVGKTPDAQVMLDLDTVVTWAQQRGGDTERLGITGFCWGGRITWLYAAHNPKVKAGVAWYGRLAGDASANSPKHPVDIAANLKTPVLGLYGGKDTGIPLDTVDRMKAELAKGNSKSEFVVYPDAGHAFHADYRPSFNELDAKDGWRRALDWFRSHGVV